MALFEDEPSKKPVTHAIGEDLSQISEGELLSRIEVLKAEIARLEAAVAGRRSSRAAADAVFRR